MLTCAPQCTQFASCVQCLGDAFVQCCPCLGDIGLKIQCENSSSSIPSPNIDVRGLVEKHEGRRSCVYTDTTGHKTIGVGFNLDNSGARSAIAAIGANFDQVYSGKQCLTSSQIDSLFTTSLNSATSGARSVVPGYSTLCSNVQAVMIDMDFNLGSAGLGSFNTFLSLVKQHKWSDAASDLRGTLWCRQVGNRCSDDSSIISSGC